VAPRGGRTPLFSRFLQSRSAGVASRDGCGTTAAADVGEYAAGLLPGGGEGFLDFVRSPQDHGGAEGFFFFARVRVSRAFCNFFSLFSADELSYRRPGHRGGAHLVAHRGYRNGAARLLPQPWTPVIRKALGRAQGQADGPTPGESQTALLPLGNPVGGGRRNRLHPGQNDLRPGERFSRGQGAFRCGRESFAWHLRARIERGRHPSETACEDAHAAMQANGFLLRRRRGLNLAKLVLVDGGTPPRPMSYGICCVRLFISAIFKGPGLSTGKTKGRVRQRWCKARAPFENGMEKIAAQIRGVSCKAARKK